MDGHDDASEGCLAVFIRVYWRAFAAAQDTFFSMKIPNPRLETNSDSAPFLRSRSSFGDDRRPPFIGMLFRSFFVRSAVVCFVFTMMKKAMRDRRRFFWMALSGAFFGVIAFLGVSANPRFETIHVLDVIRLMTAGAGFAVAIVGLALFFILGPSREDNRAGEKSGEESK